MKNKSEIIFDSRICIIEYKRVQYEDRGYILIVGTDKDSNQDKYLNEYDLQELFVYDLNNKSLSKIESEGNFTTLEVFEHKTSKDVLGKFGLDRNNNGKFEGNIEPIIFYKINLDKMTLLKVLQDEQIDQLQKLLEGR